MPQKLAHKRQAFLSNSKVGKIEKAFRQEFVKSTGDYLSVELEKYKHLTIITGNDSEGDTKLGKALPPDAVSVQE